MRKLTRLPIRKILLAGIFCAAATVLGIFENSLPVLNTIPGGKIGLANAVCMLVLYIYGAKYAFAVSVVRAFLVSFILGGANVLPYSLSGAALSMAIMACFYRNKNLSPVGICILGAFFNNTAQILTACIMLGNTAPLYCFTYLAPVSLICGGAVGILANRLLKYKNIILKEDKR